MAIGFGVSASTVVKLESIILCMQETCACVHSSAMASLGLNYLFTGGLS